MYRLTVYHNNQWQFLGRSFDKLRDAYTEKDFIHSCYDRNNQRRLEIVIARKGAGTYARAEPNPVLVNPMTGKSRKPMTGKSEILGKAAIALFNILISDYDEQIMTGKNKRRVQALYQTLLEIRRNQTNDERITLPVSEVPDRTRGQSTVKTLPRL